jgi:hypothetical protein
MIQVEDTGITKTLMIYEIWNRIVGLLVTTNSIQGEKAMHELTDENN